MHRCDFCLKGNFKTARAVSIHISRTRACKEYMDRLRNHEQASKETTQATPNNDHEMDVDGDIPWEIDGQVDGIQEEPRPTTPDQHCGVQVEEVDDEESMWMHFVQSYPGRVAQTLGHAETMFHEIKAQQEAQGLDPWAPFADAEEWGLVKWLISWVGQNAIEEFMKLPIVSQFVSAVIHNVLTNAQTSSLKMSFTSKYSLMKAIDQLPRGTEWQLKRISVEGNKLTNEQQYETEDLELWMRDPVECIRELMGNPEFDHMVSYAPERVFSDAEGKTRRYDEMWTGDWWWEMQVSASVNKSGKKTH
jgi:hypothetical protein